ncbi:DUF2202 domain-containing protein [Candidatus Saccharibacteria bacterium]|nr:DUF2202 domain-containing protein [Candidatus Saccharibacteria bacterium]
MKNVTLFLASGAGRMLRGTVGIALAYIGVLLTSGVWLALLLVVGVVVFLGALLDICLCGLVTHGTLSDKKIRGKSTNEQQGTTIALAVLGLVAFGGLAYLAANSDDADTSSQTAITATVAPKPTTTEQSAIDEHEQSQEDMLVYLIEEEKLAHDVYTVLYQQYGARVFGNILNSEQTHQDRVLTLLEARNIDDPRSSELGVFNNTELQTLYDQLITQGKQSAEEAYKVGVAIEEKDIKDITDQLATATDSDVVATLEALRNGSENHLRAFNRQLGQY